MARMETSRFFTVAIPSLILAAAVFISPRPVSAQLTGSDRSSFVAAINEDEVYIRSGNSEGHYPIGKAKRGELVRVIDEKYEWAQIQTIGPVFERFHGLVKFPERFADRLKLSDDRKSALTMGRIEIIAPNPNVRPGESWKMIARLEANENLEILEIGRTKRGELLYKIVLPKTARVWIKRKYLRHADPAEITQWNRRLAGLDPEAKRPPVAVRNTPQPVGTKDETPERVLARDTTPVNPVTTPDPTPTEIPAVTTNQPAVIVTQPGPEPSEARSRVTSAQARRMKIAAEKRFAELETMYTRLQEEPIENAEITPLRQLYLDLVEDFGDDHKTVARYANARSEQLEIWAELQQRRLEMNKIKARLKLTSTEAVAIRQAMDAGQEYIAIGRLSASIIYDGIKLPRLLRLQDPGTGRTVAYLEPNEAVFELGEMLGHLIGIVGTSDYDGGLRLTLIEPDRIDLLTPKP